MNVPFSSPKSLICIRLKLEEVEDYYNKCAEDGATDYAIEESKLANVQMKPILGDQDRIKALAKDFVDHYEKRVSEGSTIKGKAMFVRNSRSIAYEFYKEVIACVPNGRRSRYVTRAHN